MRLNIVFGGGNFVRQFLIFRQLADETQDQGRVGFCARTDLEITRGGWWP
jgi:hypothetical protein